MENNKQYKNKLHIPPIPNAHMDVLQKEFCNQSNGCTKHCDDCLFDEDNVNEFTGWFNERFKADK